MQFGNPGAVIENSIRYAFIKQWFQDYSGRGTLLDLGCGARPFYDLYAARFDKTIGADLADSPFPKKAIDIYCSAVSVPLPDSSVDVILCTEVLQDIAEPSEFFQEVKRLLKPGGILFMTTCYVTAIADGKYDNYRYTQYGLSYQLNKFNFRIERIVPVSDVIGSGITLLIKPVLKCWNILAKAFKIKAIKRWYNPLLFISVILPQVFYLVTAKLPGFKQLYKRFTYGCIGYISISQNDK